MRALQHPAVDSIDVRPLSVAPVTERRRPRHRTPDNQTDGGAATGPCDAMTQKPDNTSLYRDEFDKDSCGFGLIANLDDRPSHWVVETAVGALRRLTHRGAVAADGKTGDGCGLLLKTPESFFRAIAAERGFELAEQFAVGTVFLNPHKVMRDKAQHILGEELARVGVRVAGWRLVPVDTSVCGDEALRTLPIIQQVFVSPRTGSRAPTSTAGCSLPGAEPKSVSTRRTARFTSQACVRTPFRTRAWSCRHRCRRSTRTSPIPASSRQSRCSTSASLPTLCRSGALRSRSASWPTMARSTRSAGNRNWRQGAYEPTSCSDKLLTDLSESLMPVVSLTGSDSSTLDNMLEVHAGRRHGRAAGDAHS